MTKKDYKLIAGVFKTLSGTKGIYSLRDVATHIADALQSENPRFDRERFLAACGF